MKPQLRTLLHLLLDAEKVDKMSQPLFRHEPLLYQCIKSRPLTHHIFFQLGPNSVRLFRKWVDLKEFHCGKLGITWEALSNKELSEGTEDSDDLV